MRLQYTADGQRLSRASRHTSVLVSHMAAPHRATAQDAPFVVQVTRSAKVNTVGNVSWTFCEGEPSACHAPVRRQSGKDRVTVARGRALAEAYLTNLAREARETTG